MLREGIADNSTFREFHPVVTTVWFALVIGITMFSNTVTVLALSLVFACAYRVLLAGVKEMKMILRIVIVILVFATLLNGLFTHNGATVLFYLGKNRVTLEAFAYGAAIALMISAVLQWFVCFSIITTSDKMIYLFGAVLPVIGLVISMIFRFIPLLKKRYADISAAQRAMGRGKEKGLIRKARQASKEISILMAWSLEASIDSADSMTARGYGLRGRTSFHLFRFVKRDGALIAPVLLLGAAGIAACAAGFSRIYYYPVIDPVGAGTPGLRAVFLAAFICLLAIPLCMDLYGELRWRRSASAD